jgi:hypothetical protein
MLFQVLPDMIVKQYPVLSGALHCSELLKMRIFISDSTTARVSYTDCYSITYFGARRKTMHADKVGRCFGVAPDRRKKG